MTHARDLLDRAKYADPLVAGRERQLSVLPPSRLRTNLAVVQRTRMEQLRADVPFQPVQQEAFSGDIRIITDQRTNTPLHLTANELCGPILVPGTTGSGKTSVLAGITASIRDHHPSIPISYFDPKRDWRKRAYDDQRCIIITPTIPLNILRPPSFLPREHYHALLLDTFARSHWAGYNQHRILTMALGRAYQHSPDPSIEDIVQQLKGLGTKEFTYAERDAAGNILHKLTEFQRLTPGIYTAKGRCLTMDDLVRVPVYWPLLPGDTYEFLFTHWLLLDHQYLQSTMVCNTLAGAVVADESLQILSEHTSHMEGTPLLDRAVATIREAGISLLLTASARRLITPLVRAQANLQIAMATNDGTEAEDIKRTFQLTDDEFDHYQRLKPLECIMRYNNRWPYPILGTITPFRADEKIVNETDWNNTARARQQALLPPPSYIEVTTPPATTPPATPVVPVRPVGLSAAQDALLHAVGREIITTSADAYRKAQLALAAGDAAAKHTASLGLLTRSPIIARPGRGGSAVALELTPLGYSRIGLAPPHRTRGGDSAQHRYLVHHLAKHITGARIEQTLGGPGGKSIDILFRLTPDHDLLMAWIAANAHHLSEEPCPLAPNDLIAVEVETSAETVLNNTRNLDLGVALNITAVMPKALDAAKRHLLKELLTAVLPRIVVVDALDLLEAVREGTP